VRSKRPRATKIDTDDTQLILILTCGPNDEVAFKYTDSDGRAVHPTFVAGYAVMNHKIVLSCPSYPTKGHADLIPLQVIANPRIPENIRRRISDSWLAARISDKRNVLLAEYFKDPVKFERGRATFLNDNLKNKANDCWFNALFQMLASSSALVLRVEEVTRTNDEQLLNNISAFLRILHGPNRLAWAVHVALPPIIQNGKQHDVAELWEFLHNLYINLFSCT
jgi:hypothetical protein